MANHELILTPKTERTRDLIYSEYTSCERSIHVLLQDNSVAQYRFLLSAYREIVAGYLSTSRLDTPVSFLRKLSSRLQDLPAASRLVTEDFNAMGFYLLLRSGEGPHLFTSREDTLYIYTGGELRPFAGMAPAVERVPLEPGLLQEELFPQRLKDGFRLFRIAPEHLPVGAYLVLGCGEEARATVLEVLAGPNLAGTTGRRSVSSRFITRKVLAVPLERPVETAARPSRARPHMRRRARLVWTGALSAIALLAASWAYRALDRGPQREGAARVEPTLAREEAVARPARTVPATHRPAAVPRTELSPRWEVSFKDAVTSSPAIHDRWVVFGGRDGYVYALDRKTGKKAWSTRAQSGMGASPALQGQRVVIGDYSGSVMALDASSGREIWRRKLPQRVVSSPAILEGRVLVGCYDSYAYCLSLADGRSHWKRKTGGRIRGGAVAAPGMFIVPSYDGKLYAMSARAGEVLWKFDVNGSIAGSPAVAGDRVIVGGPDGGVYAVDLKTGALRWRHLTEAAVKGTPAVASGRVYVGSNDRHVYCLNLSDGSVVWKYQTGDVVLARPAIQGSLVFAASYDGSIYCIEADSGRLVDRYEAGGAIFSSPVADEDAVYFGNNRGAFMCLNFGGRGAF